MIIPLHNTYCPECKAAGKINRLSRDLQSPEEVFCVEGHKISSDVAESIPEAPDILEIPASRLPAPEAPTQQFAMSPPPVSIAPEEYLIPTFEASAGDVRAAPAAVAVEEPVSKKKPALTIVASEIPKQKPAEDKIRSLPGDALEIWVEIPDPMASYLRGEAAFKGKSVQEYFQEMVLFGCECRWFY